MEDYVRYLVIGRNDLRQHSYSAGIKDAFNHAVTCAQHWTMRGDVYGETKNRERVLLKPYKETPEDVIA